ncbi:putative penicillin-binding protein [Actinacidiphila reveromycinica]|uniref:Putative penicillin-binding protein n=1 Tax=Actinacidiphila reveromycinica TaxID=659352 RepID=A0A7U3UWI5_9ACTN|nr:penicillin-binding transpeptidase domain-containing protein [Streptomyces sp. SN-593]BBB00050.1 putative penicillin-binding protein [Streptomyces sp. SN-593]
MNRCVRHAAAFCLLLLLALLANAARVQLVAAGGYAANPANRRADIALYARPRGDILAGGRAVTGSRATGGRLAYVRTYADGPLYAPVTGFASQTYGATLLEGTENDLLDGTSPALHDQPLWREITRARQRGGDVHTTIDPAAQRAAYDGLAGRRGAVAALDPATGRILALVSSPSYDPGLLSGAGPSVTAAWRRLNDDPEQPMLDRAIRQTYPPGSTFKVVTAAAALAAGVVTDLRARTGSPDPYRLPGTDVELTNEGAGCRDASMYDAFRFSCNTVFAKLGADLGARNVVAQAELFGFNDARLRVPPSVAKSNVDTAMSPDQVALSSIGQYDTTATPLQMAMVAAAVGDGGRLMAPYLVDRVTDRVGTTVARTRPRLLHRAVDGRTAAALQQLMEAVVADGTGTNAAIPGAVVGGKTGTAQHGMANAGTPYAWFLSYARPSARAPASVAVAVVVEDADAVRADISGGGNAAPIARAVMEAVLKEPAAGLSRPAGS